MMKKQKDSIDPIDVDFEKDVSRIRKMFLTRKLVVEQKIKKRQKLKAPSTTKTTATKVKLPEAFYSDETEFT